MAHGSVTSVGCRTLSGECFTALHAVTLTSAPRACALPKGLAPAQTDGRVCRSLSLSLSLSVSLSPSVCLPVCLSACLPVCVSVSHTGPHAQADEGLVGRVLDSGSTNAKGANRGGLNLFTGERTRTAFASYHNPYRSVASHFEALK